MRFPNAYSGVKKIFLAEVLALIAAVAIGVVSFAAPRTAQVLEDGTQVTSIPAIYIILMVCGSILAIVSFVINLLGMNKAKQDDENFKIALIFALLGIVLSIVAAFLQNSNAYGYIDSATTVAELLASYYVMTGIMSLAAKQGDAETEKKARTARLWLEGAFIASLVMGYIVVILARNGSGALVAVGLLNIVVQMATYIIYLRGLAAGKSMLSR